MKRVDSLIGPLITDLGIGDSVKLAQIKKNWSKLFSRPLSYHMWPCTLAEGEILLNVDSPVWLQELNFYKNDILEKISSYGVKAVRFRLGRVSTKSEVRSQKSEVRSLTSGELSYIEETVSQINDQELRDKIRKALEKSIAAGKTKF